MEFRGTSTLKTLKIQDLEEKIKRVFSSKHLEYDATVIRYNGLIFLSIKERPKKKQRRTMMPVFFCLVPKEKFFFTSKKVLANHITLAVVEAMGYNNFKNIKLDGRNIPSLIRLLRARKIAEQTGFPTSAIVFKKGGPEKS